MNLFGKSKKDPPRVDTNNSMPSAPSQQGAIAKVRDTIETVSKREEHIQRKIDAEVKQAKEFAAKGKKPQALQCIKRKKMYEKQLEQIGNTKMTLETQQLQLEAMKMNKEILDAQKAAAGAMKAQMADMGGVEAVEAMVDEVEEGLDDAHDIGEALVRSVGVPGVDADEDELLAELDGLEADDLATDLSFVNLGGESVLSQMPAAPISMPTAPTQKVMTDEERELAELEASMTM